MSSSSGTTPRADGVANDIHTKFLFVPNVYMNNHTPESIRELLRPCTGIDNLRFRSTHDGKTIGFVDCSCLYEAIKATSILRSNGVCVLNNNNPHNVKHRINDSRSVASHSSRSTHSSSNYEEDRVRTKYYIDVCCDDSILKYSIRNRVWRIDCNVAETMNRMTHKRITFAIIVCNENGLPVMMGTINKCTIGVPSTEVNNRTHGPCVHVRWEHVDISKGIVGTHIHEVHTVMMTDMMKQISYGFGRKIYHSAWEFDSSRSDTRSCATPPLPVELMNSWRKQV